ncbi:DotI/IcmL/TraM family protein [Telmatospirillum siberiense]|uniref:Type IV secretion protein IcmL n=1 Tax=Telmatospirillum siberiense TaxID=382514 RepID=A0A2N3PNM3_9PROT|nr:DotI/IcmL/TraM family protein [Telmatospirillum siberiense]PKU21992.1 hypothetical protein CWS72_24110 [Telmatospirillum siberiense]
MSSQSQSPAAESSGAAQTVFTRYEFYRDGYRRATRLNIALAAAVAVSVFLAAGLIIWRPEPRYFPTGAGCSLTEMVPLNKPNLTDNRILNFAVDAVTQAHTVRHDTWRADYERTRPFFTEAGWRTFLELLQSGGTLDFIRNGRVITRGFLAGQPPVIIERGVSPQTGVYTWVVRFPFNVSYETASATKVQRMLAKVTIVRMNTLENPEGIGIESMISQTAAETDQ